MTDPLRAPVSNEAAARSSDGGLSGVGSSRDTSENFVGSFDSYTGNYTPAERLHDDLEAVWNACIPPGSFNGETDELRHAYVELVFVVADLLAPKDEGRLFSSDIYSQLSDHAADQLDPSSGGIGITSLGNSPSVLTIQTEMYQTTEYALGQDVSRPRDELHAASAKPEDLAQAAADLFQFGLPGKLNSLLAHGQDRGTARAATTHPRERARGTPRPRAIDPITEGVKASNVVALELRSYDAEGRFGKVSPVLDEWGADYARCGILGDEDAVEDLKGRTPDGGIFPWADIPTALYERIVEWAPVVEESEPFAAILQLNLFSKGRDEDWFTEGDNVGIPIPHELVFAAFGMAPQTGWDRGLSAGALLELYRREVDPEFAWSDWHHEEGKARVIKSHGIPEDILRDAKEFMLSPDDHEDWTYLITGKDATNRNWTPQLRENRREIVAENEPIIEPPDSTRRIQEYLNSLDQQIFGHGGHGVFKPSKIDDAIWTVVDTIDEEERRDQELRKLYWLRRFPQPLYLVCDRFPRLKADAHNQAMNLPSEVLRSMYTMRDYELDLSKAHLAAYVPVAKREGMDVPVLERHLEANLEGDKAFLKRGDLWHDLAFYLDLDGDPKAKRKVVKKAYSLVYGQDVRNLWFNLYREWGKLTGQWLDSVEPLKGLQEHPLMNELLSTRDKLEAVINDRGGLEDADGRPIPLSAWDEVKDKENRWRGVMAYVNASFEQEIMHAAFEEARKEQERSARSRFRIWLYQADGFTVRMGSKASHSKQVERLQNAVQQQAKALGMPTELEVDFTPTD